MRRLYRWLLRPLCRTAWTAGFDAGVQHERDAMLRLSLAQRERWYFVEGVMPLWRAVTKELNAEIVS